MKISHNSLRRKGLSHGAPFAPEGPLFRSHSSLSPQNGKAENPSFFLYLSQPGPGG